MNNCPTCGSSTFTMKNWRFETVPDKVFLEYDEVVWKIHEVETRGLEAINEMHKARLRVAQQNERIRELESINAATVEALHNLMSRVKYDKDASDWWPDAQYEARAALTKARGEEPPR